MEKLKHTLERIDRKSFDQAVDLILGARRIYILGVRSSAPWPHSSAFTST